MAELYKEQLTLAQFISWFVCNRKFLLIFLLLAIMIILQCIDLHYVLTDPEYLEPYWGLV